MSLRQKLLHSQDASRVFLCSEHPRTGPKLSPSFFGREGKGKRNIHSDRGRHLGEPARPAILHRTEKQRARSSTHRPPEVVVLGCPQLSLYFSIHCGREMLSTSPGTSVCRALWEMEGPRFSLGLACVQPPGGMVATNSHRKEA